MFRSVIWDILLPLATILAVIMSVRDAINAGGLFIDQIDIGYVALALVFLLMMEIATIKGKK